MYRKLRESENSRLFAVYSVSRAKSARRAIKYDDVVMANLWLSLMDRMGVSVERHGDSTGRLPALG